METAREKLINAPVAQAELNALRERTVQLERELQAGGVSKERSREASAHKAVNERWVASAPQADLREPGAVTLSLAPEEHDSRMSELVGILQEYGVSAAIKAAEKSKSPHLIDDFHRILVEYVNEGLPAAGAQKGEYKTTLAMALYEVTLPQSSKNSENPPDAKQAARESIALMEQFYRSMLQFKAKDGEYFSFEIANPAGSVETSLYIAVPKGRKALFQKQLLSIFPQALLRECRDDYNAFVDGAVCVGARARFTERPIYALRSLDTFPNDPLDSVLSAFSRLDARSEGASLQFVVSPTDRGLMDRYKKALRKIKEGVSFDKATNIQTGAGRVFQEIGEFFSGSKKPSPDKRPAPDDPRVKNIEQKLSSPLLHATVRVVASATTRQRAQAILEDIEAPFQQFTDTAGNELSFEAVSERSMAQFSHAFSYRSLGEAIPLSCAELASLAHLPRQDIHEVMPELRQEKSHVVAAPVALPQTGTLLGVNRFRGSETKVYIKPEDRLRHLYLVGQTGTGKSVLLKNIVLQDIKSGAGVCFIDPHGTDVLDILGSIPPERVDDVIYFDPAHIARPMGLNMLEYDPARPEQMSLVVDELIGIFKKLFGAIPESMGPAFEQYFRNAALLVMSDPTSGNTLLDISRVFSDPNFRALKLAACKNPIVRRFWEGIAEQATGEQGLQNYGPYVTSKFDSFTSNEFVRPIIAQQKSAFDFRSMMDNKKILLVNLAKGRIGDLNANLLGLVIVGKFLIAALSRADSFGKELPPFYLHIDEFQNFETPSIATILSEARKYKLSLTVAHQFIAQLEEGTRDAVFGNVGSFCTFRIGADDAEYLQKQFAPEFSAEDLMRVNNYRAFVKLLIDGKPARPFSIDTLPFEKVDTADVERMQELSYHLYGRPRQEIEAEILRNLSPQVENPATLAQNA